METVAVLRSSAKIIQTISFVSAQCLEDRVWTIREQDELESVNNEIMKLRTKIDIGLLAVICVLIAVAYLRPKTFLRFWEARIQRHGPDGREMPSAAGLNDKQIRVENSVFFSIDGERYQLLGVKESTEDVRRQKAVEFIEKWLGDGRSDRVWFSNWSHALQDPSGRWLVWAEASKADKLHCLNVDLVEAGLADVDHKAHQKYEFRESKYGGLGPFVNWRELLDKAFEKRNLLSP